MMFKSQNKMIWMIKNKWELLSLMKINRSFTLMLVRTIGNFNVKELLINSKFNPKLITKSGEQELNLQEHQQNL